MRKLMALLTVCLFSAAAAAAQECVCRLDNASVAVNNFPGVQKVNVENSVLPVKETDLTRTYEYTADFGTGERRAFGPIPLDGRKRIQFQIDQNYPKQGTPINVTLHWYVRYQSDDAFFDPCPHEANAAVCTTGFPVAGAKLRPLKPASLADLVDGFYISDASVGIATLDVVGTEGLLVIENLSSGPRQLRASLVVDR